MKHCFGGPWRGARGIDGDGIIVWDQPSGRKLHRHRNTPVALRFAGPTE
jgi:hypothetical protein